MRPSSPSSRLRRTVLAIGAFAIGSVGIVSTVQASGACGPDELVELAGVEVCAHVDTVEDLGSNPADRVRGGIDAVRSGVRQAQSGQQSVAAFDTARNNGVGDGAEDLALVCDRSSDRRRVEVLYGHPAGANRLSQVRAELENHVRFAQLQYDFSAFVAGSDRAWIPRFVTEGSGEDCRVRIRSVQLSSGAMNDAERFFNELFDRGFDDPDRAYLVFVEDGPFCGLGTLFPTSDEPSADRNPNNTRIDPRTGQRLPAFSRIDETCWGEAEAHELGHNLGAVQQSAPHSTQGSHCTDGYDAMCYDDGSIGSRGYEESSCPDSLLYFSLDCNNDDYYDPTPARGSYLDTHWNIIDNDWLLETFTDAVVVGATVGATGTRFDDVVLSNTFVRDIDDLARSGVTRGCNTSSTRFCPRGTVTREQMAAFLTRALDLPAGSATFSDVTSDNTFRADIAALADAGITRGCNPPSNTRFCPRDPVTRQQMAAFLARALDLPAGSATFSDVASNNPFRADVAALADAGITRGCNPPSNSRFCPQNPVTREQMSAFLKRAGLLGS